MKSTDILALALLVALPIYPVDAAFKAIEMLVKSRTNLQPYSVNAITQGTDSQGEVTVRLERDGVIVNGVGADSDIVTRSEEYTSELQSRPHLVCRLLLVKK